MSEVDKKYEDLPIASDLSEVSVQEAIDRLIEMVAEIKPVHGFCTVTIEASLINFRYAAIVSFSNEYVHRLVLSKRMAPDAWCVVWQNFDRTIQYSVGSPGAGP